MTGPRIRWTPWAAPCDAPAVVTLARPRSRQWVTLLCLLAAGCAGTGESTSGGSDDAASSTGDAAAPAGAALYMAPHADGNTFACASCHALQEPAPDGVIRPGHPIGDATRRPSWKNGRVDRMLDAVNSCRTEWMNAPAWAEDDPAWQALHGWLDASAPSDAAALSFTIAAPPDELGGGDADAGRATFNGRCVVCHGVDGVGTVRAPPVAGRGLAPAYVAQRVRTSGRIDSGVYDGLTGGVMPFWAADRIDDDQLRDVIAWLAIEAGPAPADAGGAGDAAAPADAAAPTDAVADPGAADTAGACPATHPKVGQVTTLEGFFHDVAGTAEIVDDCTIRVTDFHYDANGIDVRIYAGLGGDYGAGFAITEDLVRPTPFAGETVIARLPDGKTLDDLDGISVWCVAVGVDFGSGVFAAP